MLLKNFKKRHSYWLSTLKLHLFDSLKEDLCAVENFSVLVASPFEHYKAYARKVSIKAWRKCNASICKINNIVTLSLNRLDYAFISHCADNETDTELGSAV